MIDAGPDAKKIDLTGHTLLPGFIDAHTHLTYHYDSHGRSAIGIDRLCWEVTDHPEHAYSRRFVPGWQFASYRRILSARSAGRTRG